MEYTTEFNETNDICTVNVTGRLKRPDDSLTLQQFARDLCAERGCQQFLFDMTQAKIVGGVVDAFKTGTVPGDSDNKQARLRVSLVYSDNMDIHKFMENVAFNRGYNVVRVFDQMDKALEWLKPKEDKQ